MPCGQLSKSRFHDHEHAHELSPYCNDLKWATRDATPFATHYNQEPSGGHNVAKMSHRASNWEVQDMFRKHLSPRIKNPAYTRPEAPPQALESRDAEHELNGPEIDAVSLAGTNYDSAGTASAPFPSDWGGSPSIASPILAFVTKPSPSNRSTSKTRRHRSWKVGPESAAALKQALSVEGILAFFEDRKGAGAAGLEDSRAPVELNALKAVERASALAMFGEVSNEAEDTGSDGSDGGGDALFNMFPIKSKPLVSARSVAGHGVRSPTMGGRRSSLSDNYSAFTTFTLPLDKPDEEVPEDQYLASLKKEMHQGSYFAYSSPTSREGHDSYQTRTRASPAHGSPNRLQISSVRDLQLQIQSMKEGNFE